MQKKTTDSDQVKLMYGDCIEKMKDIPDESIDLTVTSPPYDNLRTYNDNNEHWGEHVWKAVIEDLYRVTKEGGVVVWVVGDATIKGSETGTSFKQALHAMECGFRLHDTMIWAKDTSPFHMSNRYYQCFEYMFVFSKGAPKTFNQICDRKNKYAGSSVHGSLRNSDGSTKLHSCTAKGLTKKIKDFGSRFNYWVQPTEKQSKRFCHPAMFPEKLAHDHIISWSNEGDIVLDPFMGSGTTGKMALLNNRNFIGIELDPEYFKIAEKRISEAKTLLNP